jgi:glycosyltransferase involved in cell wall biosynthesis
MKKITLITLEQTGAGPVYSLEMAKALVLSNSCKLQIIISEGLTNIEAWKSAFEGKDVNFNIVKAYKHTKLSVFVQFFNFRRKSHIVNLINQFNPDILYVPFGLMWARFIYAFIGKRIKIVKTIHDVESHDRFTLGEFVSNFLTWGSNWFVDGYVILNKKDKAIIEKRFNKPVTVIPHASFNYYFNAENRQQGNQIKSKIGFSGRIEPYKGLDLLVGAFEQTKTNGLKMLIAGSGAIEASLLDRIKQNKNIELINRYIDDNEFQPLLDSVDFVVLPYKRASQSGVIPMCFAYGKTVIATNVGALEEQIPEGTGIITAPNAESICSQIDNLYSNTDLILQYGNNAKEYADEYLSWDKSADLLLVFFDKF